MKKWSLFLDLGTNEQTKLFQEVLVDLQRGNNVLKSPFKHLVVVVVLCVLAQKKGVLKSKSWETITFNWAPLPTQRLFNFETTTLIGTFATWKEFY